MQKKILREKELLKTGYTGQKRECFATLPEILKIIFSSFYLGSGISNVPKVLAVSTRW